MFTKIPKYCFDTSNGTETITESILFRRLKNYCFFTLPGLAILRTLTSSKRTQNRNTPFATAARVVRQTHSFFSGGPIAVVCACRRKCVACTDRLLSPCHHHLCRLFFHVYFWLDRTWCRHSFKRRQRHEDAMAARTKRPNKRAFWTLPLGTIWQSFVLCAGLPEDRQKKIAKLKK